MAKHRRRRSAKKSLKGLGALDTTTTLLIVGGVAVVGVGAYFFLRKPDAPVYGGGGAFPGAGAGGYGPYTGTLPPGMQQSTADMLIQQYGPQAADAIVKYGPQAVDYLKNLFGGGSGQTQQPDQSGSTCKQLANFPAGNCDHYSRFGANESNGCWYGWDGSKSVIWGMNPAGICTGPFRGLGMGVRRGSVR